MKLSDRVFEVTTGTGISDSSGHLLFWTNGCYIFNANDQILPNGKINPGQIHDSYCQDELGYPGFYPMSYGHLAVPDPRAPNRYMLFQLQRSDSIGFVIGLLSTTLKHDPTTGQITVLEPNTPVFNLDTGEFLSEQLVAVKHANGRDWWILLAAFNSNNYFKFLLGPSGISGPQIATGPLEDPVLYPPFISQSCFSPDGNVYLRTKREDGLYIYDFDRCSGDLNYRSFVDFKLDSSYFMGVSVSPSSRYAYVSMVSGIYQIDLKATDPQATKRKIGSTNNSEGHLFTQMNGPDGKIYVLSYQSTYNISIIQEPDEPFPACQYDRVAIDSIGQSGGFEYPNYRLGALVGSPCDTIGLAPWGADLNIQPSPGDGLISVHLPEGSGECWIVFNAAGQLIQSMPSDTFRRIVLNTTNWPAGMYVIRGCSPEGRRYRKRFVVIH